MKNVPARPALSQPPRMRFPLHLRTGEGVVIGTDAAAIPGPEERGDGTERVGRSTIAASPTEVAHRVRTDEHALLVDRECLNVGVEGALLAVHEEVLLDVREV